MFFFTATLLPQSSFAIPCLHLQASFVMGTNKELYFLLEEGMGEDIG